MSVYVRREQSQPPITHIVIKDDDTRAYPLYIARLDSNGKFTIRQNDQLLLVMTRESVAELAAGLDKWLKETQ